MHHKAINITEMYSNLKGVLLTSSTFALSVTAFLPFLLLIIQIIAASMAILVGFITYKFYRNKNKVMMQNHEWDKEDRTKASKN